MGVYSRWALMRGWALIKFSPFSTSVVCIFWKKTVSGNNKSRRCNKASRFCKTLWRKLRLRGSLKLVLIPFLGGSRKGVGAYLSLSGSGREVAWVGVGVETGLPPLISGSGWSSPHPPPPYLMVWIRHCITRMVFKLGSKVNCVCYGLATPHGDWLHSFFFI